MIRTIQSQELTKELFREFDWTQTVNRRYVKRCGCWAVEETADRGHQAEQDCQQLLRQLTQLIEAGGTVIGSFASGVLNGFCSVCGQHFGMKDAYVRLDQLQVSAQARGKGIGSRLFQIACQAAVKAGAEYLYIQAPTAEDTVRFFKKAGCREASMEYLKAENSCALEYALHEQEIPFQDIYTNCPKLTGERMVLRLVEMNDAEELQLCYADAKLRQLMNRDACFQDFSCETLWQMQETILSWQDAYEADDFVRFAIVDGWTKAVAGTLEMFHRLSEDSYGHCGMLRLDVRGDYETEEHLTEILQLVNQHLPALFHVETVYVKAPKEAVSRRRALANCGYQSAAQPFLGQYEDYFVRKSLM